MWRGIAPWTIAGWLVQAAKPIRSNMMNGRDGAASHWDIMKFLGAGVAATAMSASKPLL
jgi:hypothetical protein